MNIILNDRIKKILIKKNQLKKYWAKLKWE